MLPVAAAIDQHLYIHGLDSALFIGTDLHIYTARMPRICNSETLPSRRLKEARPVRLHRAACRDTLEKHRVFAAERTTDLRFDNAKPMRRNAKSLRDQTLRIKRRLAGRI